MDTWGTQYSHESHLTALHHNGTILNKEDGVDFWSPKPQLCRLAWDINYAGLKEKLTPKVQLERDEQEIVRIVYRYPTMGDNNTVHFSAMEVKNDEDVQVMLDSHDIHKVRCVLQLNVETRRTVAEILRHLTPPAQ